MQELEEQLRQASGQENSENGNLLDPEYLRLQQENYALQEAVSSLSSSLATDASASVHGKLTADLREEEISSLKRQVTELSKQVERMRILASRFQSEASEADETVDKLKKELNKSEEKALFFETKAKHAELEAKVFGQV